MPTSSSFAMLTTLRPSSKAIACRPAWICRRCVLRISALREIRRSISHSFLKRKADEEQQWQEKAKEIRERKRKSMLSILEERGFINQIAGERNALDELLTSKRIGAYVGIDPTAGSLHVGHMLPLMALFWMFVHGYSSLTLLGGATYKIGDPTGRLQSRTTQGKDNMKANMVSMHYQLKKLWKGVESYARKHGFEQDRSWRRDLANNNIWLNKLSVMEFLQVLGSGMRIGPMLGKDTCVSPRMSPDQQGT